MLTYHINFKEMPFNNITNSYPLIDIIRFIIIKIQMNINNYIKMIRFTMNCLLADMGPLQNQGL